MEEKNGALVVLLRAIQNEIAGQRFYAGAARYCIDLWAKELLASLARDEETHAQLLLGQYDTVRSGASWLDIPAAVARGAAVDVTRISFPAEDAAHSLFPPGWSPEHALDRAADDLAALSLGIELEKMAVALYQGERDSTLDETARAAYDFLVGEERRHYRQLTAHWERLAGTPWEEGG